MNRRVAIGIVTWNSAADVATCLAAVRALTHPDVQVLVVDNASTDGTREILESSTRPDERALLDRNVGFSAAHNLAITRTTGDFYLALNPDVRLEPGFLARLVDAIESVPRTGSASGKLLRADDPNRIDSTGIFLVPTQRHLDRGAGELDRGQFERRELIFGPSGAAGLYRRQMLSDVAVDGEVFDQDFFAYREDADLAWRAQLLGWACVYEPTAVAHHVRRVTPERRAALPPDLNRMSVRNRFLLRIKNQTPNQLVRYLVPTLWRDCQVVGYTLLREHASLPAFVDVARLLRPMLRKRRVIMGRRRASDREMNDWFVRSARPIGAPPAATPPRSS